ncbi:MAG: hypothetical protein KDI51_19075 [Xanthomonadales bacterium]|nr:hypothetical protein [Xanthomonadales bacterium]
MHLRPRTAMLPLVLLSACAFEPRSQATPLLVRFPAIADLSKPGELLRSMELSVECAALTGLRHMPDGWSYRVDVEGENYRARVVPAEAVGHPAFQVRPIIEVNLRGQWSDCYVTRLEVRYELNGSAGTRMFTTATTFDRLVPETN